VKILNFKKYTTAAFPVFYLASRLKTVMDVHDVAVFKQYRKTANTIINCD